mmetsp:Transcript_61906/g.139312  ORF Transcript_61906/g.139312 Transcript_61906/m.139312 type:complete len:216 (+) Transcript_61906:220-867(+)
MDCFQSTGLMSWVPSMPMISSGVVWGPMGSAVVFMYTRQRGGFMEALCALSCARRCSRAPCIMGVWKAPLVLSILACRAPASVALASSSSSASEWPETEKPLGKRWLAIWQTCAPFVAETTSRQSSSSFSSCRPATESMPCLGPPGFVASKSMASPRSFTSFRPVSKSKTPATVRAAYSPSERPAMALQSLTAMGSSERSCSTAARPAMYIAGWQ